MRSDLKKKTSVFLCIWVFFFFFFPKPDCQNESYLNFKNTAFFALEILLS